MYACKFASVTTRTASYSKQGIVAVKIFRDEDAALQGKHRTVTVNIANMPVEKVKNWATI